MQHLQRTVAVTTAYCIVLGLCVIMLLSKQRKSHDSDEDAVQTSLGLGLGLGHDTSVISASLLNQAHARFYNY